MCSSLSVCLRIKPSVPSLNGARGSEKGRKRSSHSGARFSGSERAAKQSSRAAAREEGPPTRRGGSHDGASWSKFSGSAQTSALEPF